MYWIALEKLLAHWFQWQNFEVARYNYRNSGRKVFELENSLYCYRHILRRVQEQMRKIFALKNIIVVVVVGMEIKMKEQKLAVLNACWIDRSLNFVRCNSFFFSRFFCLFRLPRDQSWMTVFVFHFSVSSCFVYFQFEIKLSHSWTNAQALLLHIAIN